MKLRLALALAASLAITLLSQEAVPNGAAPNDAGRGTSSSQQVRVSGPWSAQNHIPSAAPASAPAEPATLRRIAGQVTIAEPVRHENLEVFFVEGEDWADTSQVLTLDEAMSGKAVVKVNETSQVNELTVQNSGGEKGVFIMAGDIVKGGRQDRTLASDLPLPPKSSAVPVASFCVEQGRWSKRGDENDKAFGSSKNAIASKEGKIAVRKAANQSEVWKSVADAQEKISRNIGKDVKPGASATSLQLTLEDKDLKTKIKAFRQALLPAIESHPRSLGVVFVINGEINSAEVFAGHDLFRRLWPKLLESIATEAISVADEKKAAQSCTTADVLSFVKKAEEAPAAKKALQGSLKQVSAESDDTCLFETVDEKKNGQWLRRNVIKKQAPAVKK